MIKICALDDLPIEQPRRFEVAGKAIAVVKISDEVVHAIGDRCSHGDVSLSEGFVEGETLECWAHGAKFCLKSGKALSLPAYEPVPAYKVVLQAGEVFIDLEEAE